MKKQVKKYKGKKYFLLGLRKEDNTKVWLEEASFDCDWYWGLGYVEIWDSREKEITEHWHFDSLFLKNIPESFNEYFAETTLNSSEVWVLLDLMKSLYTCREYSDLIHSGANISSDSIAKDIVKNKTEYERLNKEIIPELLQSVYSLLSK